ncbi:MAG: MBL fold metallo-hydrolase [Phycisphaerae bacterium]|nr:MBL fold metallo-hydrolase [Phycisphaerae bacterium]
MRITEGARAEAEMHLCVLASGSSGNCSVVRLGAGADAELLLIDLGLSPRRTYRLIAEQGLDPRRVRGALVTHFDHDHFHAGWAAASARHWAVFVHASHERDAAAAGLRRDSVRVFDGAFWPMSGIEADPVLNAHDESGTASFRVEGAGGSLGFATDLGSVSLGLVERLRRVDVLAIESNYCPKLQAASDRPPFLKQRIMGGSGHLSNEQAAEAVHRIEPREHVVFLHLSRQCNHPELVGRLHEGADYAFTISGHDRPTRWVRVGRPGVVVRAGGVAKAAAGK